MKKCLDMKWNHVYVFVALFLSVVSTADVLGGAISARCIDDPSTPDLEYWIQATVLRDHGSSISPTSDIQINGQSYTLNLAFSYLIPNWMAPVEYLQYGDTVQLSPNAQYTLDWQLCCRSSVVSNVSSSDSVYVYTDLFTGTGNSIPETLAPLNSTWPNGYGQTAMTTLVKASDSVYYSLAIPMETSTTSATFQAPSTVAGHPLKIDQYGLLSMECSVAGLYAAVVKLEFYDQTGVKYGERLIETVIGVGSPEMLGISLRIPNRFKLWNTSVADTAEWRVGSVLTASAQAYRSAVDGPMALIDSQFVTIDSSSVLLRWLPSVLDGGRIGLCVVRISSAGVDYDEVLNFQAKKEDVGLSERVKESLIVYPNPSQGRFTLASSVGIHQIQVVSASGALILSREVRSDKDVEISAELPSGAYILRVEDIRGSVSLRRLVIQ